MKRLLLALVLLAASQAAALAQSCPPFSQGKVLTAGQWQACFDSKQSALGFVPVNKAGDQMQGKLSMAASTTGAAGLRIIPGVAPSAPVDGDAWMTTAGLFLRVNGSTVGPLASTGITALTGDGTASGSGSAVLTLATVNSNVGGFGSATQVGTFTVNGKGLVTAAANVTVTPAVGSITGFGAGVGAALAVNTGSAGAFVVNGGSATIAGLTVTGSFTATGLVGNAALVNQSTTVNGTTCTLGSTCTVTATATSITVGTTTVLSGTDARIFFQSGASPTGVVGQYAVSGTGSVCMTTSCSMTTPALGAALFTSLAGPILGPQSNSTTAVKITKADLSTAVMTFDTTNARVGVNKTPGAFDLDVNGAVNHGGATTLAAALTYGGVTFANSSTGTGSLVGSASPTFSGTLTASTINATDTTSGTVTVSGTSTLTLTGVSTNNGAGYLCWNSGPVTFATAASCGVSDERAKNFSGALSPEAALAGIMTLRPRYYRLKDSRQDMVAGPQLGLGAQNVAAAFPELTTTGDDGAITLGDGTRQVVKNIMGLAYDHLTVPLIGAVQAHEARIRALEGRAK